MKTIRLLTISLSIFFAACNKDPVKVASRNKTELSSQGEIIGTLPDGRQVRRWVLETSDYHNHSIYVVDKATTVTDNYIATQGKYQHSEVQATIIEK